MTINSPLFVAETDESGKVAWVWVQEDSARPARAIRNFSRYRNSTQRPDAQFFGASRRQIVEWIGRKAEAP